MNRRKHIRLCSELGAEAGSVRSRCTIRVIELSFEEAKHLRSQFLGVSIVAHIDLLRSIGELTPFHKFTFSRIMTAYKKFVNVSEIRDAFAVNANRN